MMDIYDSHPDFADIHFGIGLIESQDEGGRFVEEASVISASREATSRVRSGATVAVSYKGETLMIVTPDVHGRPHLLSVNSPPIPIGDGCIEDIVRGHFKPNECRRGWSDGLINRNAPPPRITPG